MAPADVLEDVTSKFRAPEIVTIQLEDSDQPFFVQYGLLRTASPYFEKALTNGFQESENKTLKLPGCDTDVFEVLLYWLCFRCVPEFENITRYAGGDELLKLLIRLWAFTDAYLIRPLQNHAMRRILKHLYGRNASATSISLAFEVSSPESILCGVLIDEVVHRYLYENPLSASDMDIVGAMPGFTGLFAQNLAVAFKSKKWEHASYRSEELYMVEEGEEAAGRPAKKV